MILLASVIIVFEAESVALCDHASNHEDRSTRRNRWKGGGAMNTFLGRAAWFFKSDDGPTATEYAVLIALICVAVIGALSSFGVHMDNMYMSIASTVPAGGGS